MIYRIEVWAKARDEASSSAADAGTTAKNDSPAATIRQHLAAIGLPVGTVEARRVYLIDSDCSRADVHRVASELLADPIVERAEVVDASNSATAPGNAQSPCDDRCRIEIHLKPGVMDPVAASTAAAIADMGIGVRSVRTGRSYLLDRAIDPVTLRQIASRALANGVIESIHLSRYLPERFESLAADSFVLLTVALRDLDDSELAKLSREGHLFLSLPEMRAIQTYFRGQGREPTDIELETLAQTWSEHCVHKTLKSAVDVQERDQNNAVVGTRRYSNLIKDTIFASTMELIGKCASPHATGVHADFCLSVFSDNAGVIAFDETDAVCFKAETHNHPSAIEPYGGAATGAGGVIRDVLGTGLGARPIANTDVFCVAFPEQPALPRGVIHPRRVLQQVVAGVRDYGNRMGIPTINGAVYFDDRYLGNPLVFCGCIGLIPRDRIQKEARPGDAIVVMGGRTGRDGIHGATFSSAELTDTHADEFSHAVQIGNAITEKSVADVILLARDRALFTSITDCGAGGLSSAVGEMGDKIGARVDLDKAPLKYAGLRYDEIWISEAQERMVLSVPQDRLTQLLQLARSEDVEATVIGTFGTAQAELELVYRGREVGRISMRFLHHGIPMPTRKAMVNAPVQQMKDATPSVAPEHPRASDSSANDRLLDLLRHPNIASKHWIIRQYDHEVQGGSVIKPLVGPLQIGPSDAAVIRPKLGSSRGVVVGCGMKPAIADPYEMALASIDEAIRNVVAVGADPTRLALLDNFCWPSVDDEIAMGTLVRACEACRDAARAYQIPFISGKDSLHNQFTDRETGQVIRIPNTLLISAIGIIEDVSKCISMDFKKAGNAIAVVREPTSDLAARADVHRKLSRAIAAGHIRSCHDSSDGGIAVALAEMCIASALGAAVDLKAANADAFEEAVATYIIEYEPNVLTLLQSALGGRLMPVGFVQAKSTLHITTTADGIELTVEMMTQTWRGSLDW